MAGEFADRRSLYRALVELSADTLGRQWKVIRGAPGWRERHVSNGRDDSGRLYARSAPPAGSCLFLIRPSRIDLISVVDRSSGRSALGGVISILSIFRKHSASNCASADKLGDGAGNGFGLLQQHEMSRTRHVDDPNALAELRAERVAIARRSRFIIEPLNHEKRGCAGTPPFFERHTSAGREVGDKHCRPTFDLHQYFGIGRW